MKMEQAVEAPLIKPESSRMDSLDVFRGFTLAAMLLVNNPGNWSVMYSPLGHADWHGCTFTDLIFPGFAFIMGVAMTFSFDRRLNDGTSKSKLFLQVVKRTLIIYGLGITLSLIGWFMPLLSGKEMKPLGEFLSGMRLVGVLHRLAFCYFFASLIFFTGLRAKGQALVVGGLLIFYHIIMKYVPVPGFGPGMIDKPGTNLSDYIDSVVMGKHNYQYIKATGNWHDPEGLLSTIPAVATTTLGAITGYWIKKKTVEGYEKVASMMVWGLALVIAGWYWGFFFPLNKKIWSPSFVLFTAGWSLLGLGATMWLVDIKKIRWWTKPFIILGTNAILAFFTVGVAARIIGAIKIGEGDKAPSLRNLIYKNYYDGVFSPYFGEKFSSMLFGLTFVVLWVFLLSFLYRRKIFLRV